MSSETDLVLVEGMEGILAIGSQEALDEWQQSAGTKLQTWEPQGLDLSPVAASIPGLVSLGQAVPRRFLPAAPGSRSAARAPELRLLTRRPDGTFLSNDLVDPALLLKLNPKVMLVSAALETLVQSLADIREALEEVKENIQELLKQSEADRLGDIYGRNKVLRRVIRGLDQGAPLTSADWDALASMGPDLQIGTERLRHYLKVSFHDLDYAAAPAKRAKQLQQFMESGCFVDQLKLLVVAEESLALYHRIRLERVRQTEPEAIAQTVSSIQHVLESNIEEDMALATQLNEVIEDFAVLRPAEGLGIRVRGKLEKLRVELKESSDAFVRHRAGQVADWELGEHANVQDAFRHYRGVLHQARHRARQATANGLAGVAKRIELRQD